MRDRDGGFTLIEMLVVICIIAILTGLVTAGIHSALVSSRTSSSEVMLQNISGALSTYQTQWGDYPPSTVAELGGRPPNGVCNGIEALVACLASKKRSGPLYQPPADEQYTNVDGDQDAATAKATDWFFGDSQLREYSDFFGFTLIYLHHKDYAKPRAEVVTYRFSTGGEEFKVLPEKSPATKAFVNPGRFQLRSPGRDGKPDTGDDVRTGN